MVDRLSGFLGIGRGVAMGWAKLDFGFLAQPDQPAVALSASSTASDHVTIRYPGTVGLAFLFMVF